MKIAFTVGGFDCIGLQHTHLIKEIRKNCLKGKFYIAVFEDYPFFTRNKFFPIQNQEHRINNLKFLVGEDNLYRCLQWNCFNFIDHLSEQAQKNGDKLSLVVYRDQEPIPEVAYCKEQKIYVKFIKTPKYETKNN